MGRERRSVLRSLGNTCCGRGGPTHSTTEAATKQRFTLRFQTSDIFQTPHRRWTQILETGHNTENDRCWILEQDIGHWMDTKSNKKHYPRNDKTLPITNKQNKRQNAPSMTTHFAINAILCCSWSHLFHWRVDCKCDNSQLNQGCFQIEEIVSKWSNAILAAQVNPVLSYTEWLWERGLSTWTI